MTQPDRDPPSLESTAVAESTPEAGAGGLGDFAPPPTTGGHQARRPRPRWYRHVPPVEVSVACSGGQHRLRWRRGVLAALEHDADAERALVALGGERPACLDVLATWRDAVTGKLPPDTFDLPADLRRVATLARLVRVERRWSDPDLPDAQRRIALDRLVERFRQAVAASLQPSRRQRGMQRIEVNVRPVPSGERIAVEAQTAPDRIRLQVELGLAWGVQVAGRDLGAVGDAVVLDVVDSDPASGALGVTAICWDVPRARSVHPRLESFWVARDEGGAWQRVEVGHPVRAGRAPWWSVSAR